MTPRAKPTTPFAVVLACGLALTGCASGEPSTTPAPDAPVTLAPDPGVSPDPTTSPTPDPTETAVRPEFTPMPDLTIAPDPGALPTAVPAGVTDDADVRQAVADEAARAGVPEDEVTVAGYADVTWRDGSLGCPQPGMMYTQALVPGRQLVLTVDGRPASYHAAAQGEFTYCATPVAPSADFGTR
ncbi:hypothetical protein PCC79_01845 [Propioniciclava soli]|uniref:LppP/LprE family lipoprotein n=1 Tax=Propioniciclava soli TaxID=2775081 RepID=A0ABZ3C861_9ACTN